MTASPIAPEQPQSSPESAGNEAESVTPAEWIESGKILYDAGQVGGDYQASPSASRRFVKRLDDGTFLTMDVYAYVSDEYHQKGMSREEKVWEVEEVTELTHHSEEGAPGDSEITSEREMRFPFDTAGLTKRRTLTQARDHIRSLRADRI